MPHEVIMPALGMAQDTGKIVSWLKNAGDVVKAGDALFEVETDKATMEVEAPSDGFLTDVQADAGADVPVGQVIAMISATASGSSAPTAKPEPDSGYAADTALPQGTDVIMPALGMAQDTGLIVAWHKAPGDAVAASDILFEVETDKATMDVEAGADGFVAALLAEAGEAAPVGDRIAIISAQKPDAPVQRSLANAPNPTPEATPKTAPSPAKTAPAAPQASAAPQAPAAKAPAPQPADGRILASPKARRLALEQGLDLSRLVDAGHPQPYHVADLDVLKALPTKAQTSQATPAPTRRLTATLPVDGFAAFALWAADSAKLTDAKALLAGLAAASLGRDRTLVAVESFGQSRLYAVPLGPLGQIAPSDGDTPPDLILRDLRHSRISSVDQGAEAAPVLTITRAGDGLSLTLECAGDHLTAPEAIRLLSDFAGRIEQPLRHLL